MSRRVMIKTCDGYRTYVWVNGALVEQEDLVSVPQSAETVWYKEKSRWWVRVLRSTVLVRTE